MAAYQQELEQANQVCCVILYSVWNVLSVRAQMPLPDDDDDL